MKHADHALLRFVVVDLEIEDVVELLRAFEDIGHEEVQQRPELVKIIPSTHHTKMSPAEPRVAGNEWRAHGLERGSGEEKSVLSLQSANGATQLGFFVLDAVRFVDDQIP